MRFSLKNTAKRNMSSAGCKSSVVEFFFIGVYVKILGGGVNFFLEGGGLIFFGSGSSPTLFSGLKSVKSRLNTHQNLKKTRPNLEPI